MTSMLSCNEGPLKIGVDVSCWNLQRGFGRHTRCLIAALLRMDTPHKYTLFVSHPDRYTDLGPRVNLVVVPGGGQAAEGGGRAISDILVRSWVLSRSELDVLFFPTSYNFVPLWTRAVKMVMFHDVSGFAYPDLVFGDRASSLLWKVKTYLARLQADQLLTISNHSRSGLARQFNLPEDRFSVVGEAASPAFRPLNSPTLSATLLEAGVGLGRRYLVYLGGFGPLKNLERLIEAFAAIADEEGVRNVDLLLVGAYKQEAFYSRAGDLRRLVQKKGLGDRVVFTGFLPDEDLVILFNLAEASALVSFNEGFGLPAVEAAACGCPTVATRFSPLPELLGEGGLYVDPFSVQQIEEALLTILTDGERRGRMAQAALCAARTLSWEDAARQLLQVLEDV